MTVLDNQGELKIARAVATKPQERDLAPRTLCHCVVFVFGCDAFWNLLLLTKTQNHAETGSKLFWSAYLSYIAHFRNLEISYIFSLFRNLNLFKQCLNSRTSQSIFCILPWCGANYMIQLVENRFSSMLTFILRSSALKIFTSERRTRLLAPKELYT